ncbi:hypothetical protein PG999_004133 [Apiospora kogelbergensis]|uniref:Uncharacterized protein n=1 Tax=Apiospora kogelbergensis TaxID=1337665 RepID=A0AAW0R5F9_9PEZI
MPWATNPLFKRSQQQSQEVASESDVEAAAPPVQDAVADPTQVRTGFQEPSTKLTGYQIFYLFGLDGVGAFILSGGINFAIAYAMYTTQKYTDSNTIRLFQLPNTLAGDMAVTIFIQCIITWLVELILVNRDLASGGVQAIGFVPEPTNRLVRWYMFLDRAEEGGDAEDEAGGFRHWARFLGSQVVRALVSVVPCFVLLFGPSVGLLTLAGTRIPWGPVWDWTYATKWAPQIFKLLLGGFLSLLTGPAFAAFWLVRCGWALKKNEARYGQA